MKVPPRGQEAGSGRISSEFQGLRPRRPPNPRNPFLPFCLPPGPPGPAQPWCFTTQMGWQGGGLRVLQIHLQLDHPAARFVRAAGHPNLSLQGQGDTEQGAGCQGHMWSISHQEGHTSGQRHHFLHLLFVHPCFLEGHALPLSWGCVRGNRWWMDPGIRFGRARTV